MKLNTIIKNVIFTMLLFMVITSCKNNEKENINKIPTENSTSIPTKTTINNDALATLDTSYYDSNGDFYREILMPTKKLSNGQRDPSFDLKNKFQKDISKNGNYILFELYQHGNGNRQVMDVNLVKQDTPIIKASSFSNFNPSDRKNVYVFSYHDEDFQTYKPIVITNIYKHIQAVVEKCVNDYGKKCNPKVYEEDIIKIIYPNSIDKKRPHTIGGGVLPPK